MASEFDPTTGSTVPRKSPLYNNSPNGPARIIRRPNRFKDMQREFMSRRGYKNSDIHNTGSPTLPGRK